jgi:aspartate-semialdehyde dehydrogenase
VIGTAFEAVSGAGCAGIESLQAEAIALFGQRTVPEPTVFPHGIAFNCIPMVGEAGKGAETEVEEALARGLRRLLGAEFPMAVTAVRVPTFSGSGASIAVEVAEELSAAELSELLAKSPEVAVPGDAMPSPTIREATESEMVLVGRIRRDPTSERGLLLWLAADPVRLAASNAVPRLPERAAPWPPSASRSSTMEPTSRAGSPSPRGIVPFRTPWRRRCEGSAARASA